MRNILIIISLLIVYVGLNAQPIQAYGASIQGEPRVTADVAIIFIIGQSNAVGYGTGIYSPYDSARSDVFIYYKTASTSADNGTWETLKVPDNTWNPTSTAYPQGYGIEPFLTEKLFQKLRKFGYKYIFIVKAALGGTILATQWMPPNDDWYTLSTQHYFDTAYSRLSDSITYNLEFVYWYQGESDAPDFSAAYQVNEKKMLDSLRNHHSSLNNAKVISIIPNQADNKSLETQEQINTIQEAKYYNDVHNNWYYSININDLDYGLDYINDSIHISLNGFDNISDKIIDKLYY